MLYSSALLAVSCMPRICLVEGFAVHLTKQTPTSPFMQCPITSGLAELKGSCPFATVKLVLDAIFPSFLPSFLPSNSSGSLKSATFKKLEKGPSSSHVALRLGRCARTSSFLMMFVQPFKISSCFFYLHQSPPLHTRQVGNFSSWSHLFMCR